VSLELVPINFVDACSFITSLHRHHPPAAGHKFSIGAATTDGELVGVACVGRPVAKAYQDGRTLEVNRTCTDGHPNANSMLYGAAARAVFAMGYRRLITYTQDGESGASLRAAGWRVVAERPARRSGWDSATRRRMSRHATEVARTLWEPS
jgi:hypothetical protein